MTAIAWYTSSSILEMRCDIVRSRRLLRWQLLRRRCAAIARSSGRELVRLLETLVGCCICEVRALVLPAGRDAEILTFATTAIAAAVAAAWATWLLVRLAGPSGVTTGTRRWARTCTAAVSLAGTP